MAYLFSDICASHINAYSVYSATVVFACLAEQPLKAPQYAIPRGGPVGSEHVQKRGANTLCAQDRGIIGGWLLQEVTSQ